MVSVGEEPLLEELSDRLWELSAATLLGGGERGHHVCGTLTRLGSPHGTGRCGRLLGRRHGGRTNCDGGREVVGGHVAGGEHELLVGVVWAMSNTRGIVVAGDALLGGERVPIARGGRGGRRRGGKGTPARGCWPGSGGRRRIGAVVMIERELGTGTRSVRAIDGGGELEGAEILMGWVPGGRCRGRGAFREGACWGEGAEGRGRGGWLRGVGKGVDWGKEEALVEGGRRLLVEGGRIGRGLGVGAHPAEVVGVGWVHGRRRREVEGGSVGSVAAVVAGAASGAASGVPPSGATTAGSGSGGGGSRRNIHERQRRQRTDGRQRRWRRRRGKQREVWISQSKPVERQRQTTDSQIK
jgi:hypothetical protein